MVQPLPFVVFAIRVVFLLLSLFCKRLCGFEVSGFLSDVFWEVVVVYAWVWLVRVSLFILDDEVVPDSILQNDWDRFVEF